MTTISQLKSACKHPSNQVYVIFNILPCSKSRMPHSNIPIRTTKATNVIQYYTVQNNSNIFHKVT